jgi:hypothetical protein
MAKRRKRKSLAAVFKKYYAEHPEWLEGDGNAKAIAQFEEDHAGRKANAKVRQAMYNVKSALNKGETGAVRQGGKKAPPRQMAAAARRTARPSAPLSVLEAQIDECMFLARHIEKEQMQNVLANLHRARNAVVVMIGS